MRKKNTQSPETSPKKGVSWADSKVVTPEEEVSSIQSIAKIKKQLWKLFTENNYGQLKVIFEQSSQEHINKLFSADNYELCRKAACHSNIEALSFMINAVPKEMAHGMACSGNFSIFKGFLCSTCTLEEHDPIKFDHEKRIAGFKIFTDIEHEVLPKVFNECLTSLSKPQVLESRIKADFDVALLATTSPAAFSQESENILIQQISDLEVVKVTAYPSNIVSK